MTKEALKKIKKFAVDNWCSEDELNQVYSTDGEVAVTNPWIDHSGRFSLTDTEAVDEWGLDVVIDFCEKAIERMKIVK